MTASRKTRAARAGDLPGFKTSLPKTRRAQVAEILRKHVLSGKIEPGTQLIESRLSRSLGVSRSSIREAIWELVDQGLLVNRPYAGTFVVSLDEKAMCDLFALRGALERFCFTELWPRRDETFGAEFTGRHEALVAAVEAGDEDKTLAAELHFHSFPYQYADNQALREVWEQLYNRIQLGIAMTRGFTRGSEFVENNRRYLDAALGDDLATMLREIDRHLQIGVDDVRDLMGADPRTGAQGGAGAAL